MLPGMQPWDLENIRRSLAMAPPDGPATALTNSQAVQLIGQVIELQDKVTRLEADRDSGR